MTGHLWNRGRKRLPAEQERQERRGGARLAAGAWLATGRPAALPRGRAAEPGREVWQEERVQAVQLAVGQAEVQAGGAPGPQREGVLEAAAAVAGTVLRTAAEWLPAAAG